MLANFDLASFNERYYNYFCHPYNNLKTHFEHMFFVIKNPDKYSTSIQLKFEQKDDSVSDIIIFKKNFCFYIIKAYIFVLIYKNIYIVNIYFRKLQLIYRDENCTFNNRLIYNKKKL